jgi:hypothetical protein
MDNEYKIGEFGIFFTNRSIGIGFGSHYEDKSWENEFRLTLRTEWHGIKDFITPYAWSAWKKKEIAHETSYNWGFAKFFINIQGLKATSNLLRQ